DERSDRVQAVGERDAGFRHRRRGSGRSSRLLFAGFELQRLQLACEAELTVERGQPRGVALLEAEGGEIELQIAVVFQGDQLLAQLRLHAVFFESFFELLAFDLVQMLVDAVDRTVARQELFGGLGTYRWDPW